MTVATSGDKMVLDETSRVIGQLEAAQKATQTDVAELNARTELMDKKLDRLLARRTDSLRVTVKHWLILLAGGSVGGGGIAHVLRKIFE